MPSDNVLYQWSSNYPWVVHVWMPTASGNWCWQAWSEPFKTLDEAVEWFVVRRGTAFSDRQGTLRLVDKHQWRIYNYDTKEEIPGDIIT